MAAEYVQTYTIAIDVPNEGKVPGIPKMFAAQLREIAEDYGL